MDSRRQSSPPPSSTTRPFPSAPSSLLPLLFLLLFLPFPFPFASSSSPFSSVCQFPALDDWLNCQRDQQAPISDNESAEPMALPLNGWFCDPESSISMSEVSALDESIRRLYADHGHNCVCPTLAQQQGQSLRSPPPHCWYRFDFAFVRQIGGPGPDVITADQCSSAAAANESEQQSPLFHEEEADTDARKRFQLPQNWESDPDHAFSLFAQNFAQVLRERWALGRCGEDILLLIVQRPPVQQLSAGPLSSGTVRLFGPLPMLFIAPGPLALDRLGPGLDLLIREANSQLQRDGRPLFRVLGQLLQRIGSALGRAQPGGHHRPKLRSHVPLWAWAVFAACGIAFGLMALGLFLIRTGTRRGGAPGGQPQGQGHGAMVARRHWKEEEQPPPPTYVNLVQMLMPHPKPPPTNLPQQV